MIIKQQDWLGHNPFYYNRKTGAYSTNINEVIDFANLEFDPEGLINYLNFGYSVFGKTPVRDVYFLRQNEVLSKSDNGVLQVKEGSDPCISALGRENSEELAMGALEASVSKIGNSLPEEQVLIPTSGGYDSRLLNYFYPFKKNILACSYGLSTNQEESSEVAYAKALCDKLDINWRQIKLGYYHRYIDPWMNSFGASTHAHGMYHWEFYSKIKEEHSGVPMISGIVGDLWAGNCRTVLPANPTMLIDLGLNRGVEASSNQCLLKSKNSLLSQEYESKRTLLADEKYRVLYLVRTKIILLQYLMSVPRELGLVAKSPFTDFDVAMSMLNIPYSRWCNRLWQKDFMEKISLDLENQIQPKSFSNTLDYDAINKVPLKPLNKKVLSQLFKEDYINWINHHVNTKSLTHSILKWLHSFRKISKRLNKYGLSDKTFSAYSAYMVLKPLEHLLLRAEASRKAS